MTRSIPANSHPNTPSIHNDTTSANMRNNISKEYVTPIDNEWEYRSTKEREYFLKHHHNISENQTLKRHVRKLKEYFLNKAF